MEEKVNTKRKREMAKANSKRRKKDLQFRTEVSLCEWKKGPCCTKLQCSGKWSREQVLTLRTGLKDRDVGPDRRAFLSNRMNAGGENKKAEFFCDAPANCNGGVPPLQPLLGPRNVVQVCATFFKWAYHVSSNQITNNLATRIETGQRVNACDAPKAWR